MFWQYTCVCFSQPERFRKILVFRRCGIDSSRPGAARSTEADADLFRGRRGQQFYTLRCTLMCLLHGIARASVKFQILRRTSSPPGPGTCAAGVRGRGRPCLKLSGRMACSAAAGSGPAVGPRQDSRSGPSALTCPLLSLPARVSVMTRALDSDMPVVPVTRTSRSSESESESNWL